jgi:hypothetical protein
MTATIVIKNSEKVLIWLHRERLTMTWLAGRLGLSKARISQKIKDKDFSELDILTIRGLGCPL